MTIATNTSNFGVARLEGLMQELERQAETRLDTVIDLRQLTIGTCRVSEDKSVLGVYPNQGTQATEFLDLNKGLPFKVGALKQFGRKMNPKVPSKFLTELADKHPTIAASMLDDLGYKLGKRLLFRQLDGQCRAVLSSRYRMLDHYDLVFHALETAKRVNAKVVSCSLSDDFMRIKLICPQLFMALKQGNGRHTFFTPGELANPEWKKKNGIADELDGDGFEHDGEIVWPGCEISNSETGRGGTTVRPFLCDRACFNMSIYETSARSVHLGAEMQAGIYPEETVSAASKAIMLKVRDSITACFDKDKFAKIMDKRDEANADVIHAPSLAVDKVVDKISMPKGKRDQLLAYFLGDYTQGNPTRAGLSQALSRMAQDEFDSGDQASVYEQASGEMITAGRSIIGTV